jgi:hypothetical protein
MVPDSLRFDVQRARNRTDVVRSLADAAIRRTDLGLAPPSCASSCPPLARNRFRFSGWNTGN